MRGKGKGTFGHTLFKLVYSTHILQFPFFFFTNTGLASHSGWNTSLMNPATRNFCNSSPIARRCFTGLELGQISRECSATSLGMPGMSEGLHAKNVCVGTEKV